MTDDRDDARAAHHKALGKLADALENSHEVREVAVESRRLRVANHWTELLIAAMEQNR